MAIPLDNAVMRASILRAGLPVPEEGRLHLAGIRGAVPHDDASVSLAEPQLDAYRSTILLFGTAFLLRLGSVDPGRDFTVDPLNPEGAAHLEDGCWMYRRGLHKGHPALVQAGAVKVRRDRNRDGKIEPGDPERAGWFGIDIHSGGARPEVGAWSAGCQVIRGGWDSEAWLSFKQTVYAAPQETFRYYLVPAAVLQG